MNRPSKIAGTAGGHSLPAPAHSSRQRCGEGLGEGKPAKSMCRMIEFRLDPQVAARFDASDVVQETEMEALRRLPDYLDRRPMPFRLWLRKMAVERLLNLRRHHFELACRSVTREVRLSDRSSCELARQLAAASCRAGPE